jgi:DNA-binding response OmpR family regulator
VEKLLIIDDDTNFSNQLKDALLQHDWIVEQANNGIDGLQLLNAFSYDLILLDWSMPGMAGIDLCRKFRAGGGQTPIIFLTGHRELEDKEAGLDAGGDDYLTKPFETRELLARIRSIQRRPRAMVSNKLSVRGLKLDAKLRCASYKDAKVQLSPTENNILEFLMRNKGSYFTAAQIFKSVCPSESEASEETVRVHMKFLRTKLSKIGADQLLETVKAAGYIIRDEEAPG